MRIVRTVRDLAFERQGRVGFVPTMGALHEGHLSLIRKAREECDLVVVSIFVNPLQFGPSEDFDRYPRDEAKDTERAGSAGADLVFAPSVQDVYPRPSTKVIVPEIADRWEGEHRPGHFDGVATVVCKLFNMVRPEIAYFGLKDFQQCAVIRRMVEDLNMPLALKMCETLREADGLAMSSRNVYLSDDERPVAPELYRQLMSAANELRANPDSVDAVLAQARAALVRAGFDVEYFALVDDESLEPLAACRAPAAIIAAARLGRTRLIDNVQILD